MNTMLIPQPERPVSLLDDSPLNALKRFIVLSLKTMFRGGASGGQIRDFLETYMPDEPGQYNGTQIVVALNDLRGEGVLERRGLRWCLSRP